MQIAALPCSRQSQMTSSVLRRFLTQVGTVDTAQQRKELFGTNGVGGSTSEADKQPASDPLQEATPATISSTSTGIKKIE